MYRTLILRAARWLCGGLLALTLLPVAAQAAAPNETVTILVDFTTPAGTAILGTIVGHRVVGAPTTTAFSFTGMVNGKPAHAAATATERWADDGHAQITITDVQNWAIPGVAPAIRQLTVAQIAEGLISVNGLPIAIDGFLKAPGGGRLTYVITNAGGGALQILTLPNTGGGPAAVPGSLALVSLPGTPAGLLALVLVAGLAALSGLLAWPARPWRKAPVAADAV